MAHPIPRRKCLHCKAFFTPDHRNVRRQRYCSKSDCRYASKVDSQRRWLSKPENRDHFRGPENVKRVQLWRQANPGYWRRKPPKVSQRPDALQETLTPQETQTQSVSATLERSRPDALQDSFFLQPAVLVGLIAQLTGLALQEDIASTVRRLQQLGRDILAAATPRSGGDLDGKTPDLHGQAAPRATAVQLGGSAPGP